jgi:hypothetical protein
MIMQQLSTDFFHVFELEMQQIKNSSGDPICKAKQALSYIEEKRKILFQWLEKFTFETDEDEIHFFKEIKLKITSKFIFYNKLLDIEFQLPTNSKKLRLKHYQNALNKCYQHSKTDKHFYKYYRTGCCHNDHLYFIRNSVMQILNSDINVINHDKKVCTSHDLKVANIVANDTLVIYLEEKIEQINNNYNTKRTQTKSKLTWTGTKIEIVELIYSLYYQKIFNGGKAEIKEIAEEFSRAFNIQLDNSI